MNGNLTLERIGAPLLPEYLSCRRCGHRIDRDQYKDNTCQDCQLTGRVVAHQQRGRGATRDSSPDFEVTIFLSSSHNGSRNTPGGSKAARLAINQAGFTYLTCNVDEDPVALHFVSAVLKHHWWPVVTVTSYGQLLGHWSGQQTAIEPNRYTQLQGLWEQVQTGTAKPLIF